MWRKNITLLTGLFIILGSTYSEASHLKIINHTIFATNGSWLAKAIVKVNDKTLVICPKQSTECPSESLIGIHANKTYKVEVISYVFGNGVLHIDERCNRNIIAKRKETITFDLYGSPSNNIGFGSTIICDIS